jgi:hypothetical protein
MKQQILFSAGKMNWVAVGLMALQLVVKFTLEISKSMETANIAIVAVAIAFSVGWSIAIALCLAGRRAGYWIGAVLGLLHFVMTIPLPMIRVCNHYVFAAVVAAHGILIAASCMAVLILDARDRSLRLYGGEQRSTTAGFALLGVSTFVRLLWITFREPTGATLARAATAGTGGIAEIAGQSLLYIVAISMIALCLTIPGIVMKRRWAYVAAAVFGGVHVVLTVLNVILHVNQGLGPVVVIPASLGMLVGGIWMLRSD